MTREYSLYEDYNYMYMLINNGAEFKIVFAIQTF